ncbi:hypothetical protein [Actinophytocola sp. NPDC049390]|uniref:hypothetical protein n=1 Tax=Actinophytocola sp. NPDC049390 TaxID=3363894 RepID=UPI0037B0501B
MRGWVAVAAGVMVLLAGCVSRTAEPTAAVPTTTTTTTSPTARTPDPKIGTEMASILSDGDAGRFNERICPGTPRIKPVSAIGADYAHTLAAGVESRYLPGVGDRVVARLSVRAGLDLVLVLGLNYNTHEWCTYSFTWCPIGATGLPPFAAVRDSEYPASEEFTRSILCGG